MEETVHKTVMLLRLSKQIVNSFAKIISGYKGEFKTLSNIWDGGFTTKLLLASEAHSKCCQASKMEHFAKIVKNYKPFTICAKTSILDVWKGSECASELASKVKGVWFLNQFEYQR